MITFQPKSDDELQREMLIPEGEYNFEITKATEKVSKAGNPMIEIAIKVWDKEGKERYVYDYLMTSRPSLLYRIKNLCEAIGKNEIYEKGQISETDLYGASGKLTISIQSASVQHPAKNIVKNYIASEIKPEENEDKFDDDLPF